MKKLIPSKEVRELIERTGREFSDFEKAVLIYNGDLPYYEKLDMLKELSKSTKDSTLKAMLEERVSKDEEDSECFAKNTEGYVYILNSEEFAPEDFYCGCFVSKEMAYTYGLKLAYNFRIEKHLIIGFNETQPRKNKSYANPYVFDTKELDELVIESESSSSMVASFYYTKEGTLRYFYSSEIERDAQEELERLFNTQRFENSYIDIPNPFEVGDIVCLTTDNGHGVVVTSQEDWRQYKEIMKNAKYKNFGDASIIVDFLMDNGHISHAHVNPIFLGKYEPAEIDADKEVLYAASAVHKGDGLDWFTHCYDKYKKMCVRKASTLS